MASITLVFTDNGDGTATVTSSSVAAQTATGDSLQKLIAVARGWVGNAIPLLVLN
jgi:hydroxymethylpyrimidine/phosphomethylpyrimidine kinase